MLIENSFFKQPSPGLEEPTRPATRPVQPTRPTERADHVWLATSDGLLQVGAQAPDERWTSELQQLANLLGPHLREGAESTFEIVNGYTVVCVATPRGWLMAVGVRGQDVRDLRRDALVMSRLATMNGRRMMEPLEGAKSPKNTFASLGPRLSAAVALEPDQVGIAQHLWGTIGPLLLNDDGEFELMAHLGHDELLVDFEQQWNAWTHRMRLATGIKLPTADEIAAS